MQMANPTEKSEQRLKHLQFLSSSAELSSAYLSKLYNYLKEHSGFLGPIVEYLKDILNALVGYFDKEHQLLHDLLLFADNQVDKVTKIIETHGPDFAKKILSFVQWAFDIIGELCDATIKGENKYDTFVKNEYVKLRAKLDKKSETPPEPARGDAGEEHVPADEAQRTEV